GVGLGTSGLFPLGSGLGLGVPWGAVVRRSLKRAPCSSKDFCSPSRAFVMAVNWVRRPAISFLRSAFSFLSFSASWFGILGVGVTLVCCTTMDWSGSWSARRFLLTGIGGRGGS